MLNRLNRLFYKAPIEITQIIQTMSLAHLTKLVASQSTFEDTKNCLQQINNFHSNQPEQLAAFKDQTLNDILNLIARIMCFATKETLLSFAYEAEISSISHLYSSNSEEKITTGMRNKDLVHFEQINSLQEKYASLKKMHSYALPNLSFLMRFANNEKHEPLVDSSQEIAILEFMEDLLDAIREIYFPSLSPSPTRMREV